MPFGNRGIISRLGNTLQIKNAFVEEISLTTNTTGFIIVSYVETNRRGISTVNFLRLNINRNTAILNLSGGSSCLCDIREGMWIDAVFCAPSASSLGKRSLPKS